MLEVTINYDSRWCNSFLDGDNNAPLPKEGRSYVASNTKISAKDGDKNFIRREITHDTVMGVLNRLIGDQRKLYMSRESEGYYFSDIEREKKVTFEDSVLAKNQEMVYLRNFSKSFDRNSFSGMVNSSHPAFSSYYSKELWSVLFLDPEELCDFILDDSYVCPQIDADPIIVAERYESFIGKIKPVNLENPKIDFIGKLILSEKKLSDVFGVNYRNSKGKAINVYSLYCSALYLQLARLSQNFEIVKALSKTGLIAGFSKKGFTYKDFMKFFTTGKGKMVFGNPYFIERFIKGEGKSREMLVKASGVLKINLDVSKDRALEITKLIHNAGVMSFPLGKKGLAYVASTRIK